MRWLGVVPSIWQPYTDACLASMHPAFRANVMVVDNTTLNHGVAASWNRAARIVLAQKLDYLVTLSASCRFGPAGGMDFIEDLSGHPGAWLIEANEIGWHLLATSRSTLAQVGLYDENCWPAYHEDVDYGWRVHLAAHGEFQADGRLPADPYWPKVQTDVRLESVAHGISIAHAHVEFVYLEEYMARKWNGHKDRWHEQGFTRPFNDPDHDLKWWPTPPDQRCYVPWDRPPEVPWGSP